MKYIKIFVLLLIFSVMLSAKVNACTNDGTCLTDCPTPPLTGAVNRPWCLKIPEFGDVTVNSNIASSWSITGPAVINGVGTYQQVLHQPVGAYTITWGAVGGYITPASKSFTIENDGDTITFDGVYVAAAPSVNIYFSFLHMFKLMASNSSL